MWEETSSPPSGFSSVGRAFDCSGFDSISKGRLFESGNPEFIPIFSGYKL